MRLNFLVVAAMVALALPCAALAGGLPAVTVPVADQTPSMGGETDASWSAAATLSLDNDFTYRHAASEPTAVRVAQDKSALDIGFVVTQKESLTEAQETNGPGVANDDNVTVYLFPQGAGGFAYSFSANPRG
ncbi:MAG TPA: hypothetical protein VJN22_05720, partial [Candidatus Eremiobacteraceae bacterium]|nr:hypothetical protein [Candidatus Eremiobacteraceae bacterium]